MSAIIYLITNTLTGKQYVGQTIHGLERRWKRHCCASNRGSTCHLHNAIRKYGVNVFTYKILEETPLESVNEREMYWIAELNTKEDGYNLTDGGAGARGWVPSVETRQRMSEALTGIRRSPETRQRMSRAQKGRPRSPEYRAKISASLSGEKHPRYGKTGDQHPLYGKRHSEESRRKMQASQLKYLWEVITPTGDIVRVTNLKQYCREHGISQPHLITHGHTKGYRAVKVTP